ncbi:MAG: SHOCT domain-containing protein [Ruminococcus sp.]|nr:SHOCT domain-containing protein [Ruminococcus sp.]
MRSSTLYNKLTGGNTVAIRSASGLIKFPWVQNAEEFVNATLAKIEEYKKTVKKDNQELIKAVAETAAAPANTSSASKIKEIKELLDQGLISQEEFDAKRKELLEKM